MPRPRAPGKWVPQPARVSCGTARAYALRDGARPAIARRDGVCCPSRSSRNYSGSRPACASSSMKLCTTHENTLLPGAHHGPHRDAAFQWRLFDQAVRHPAAGELIAAEICAAARSQDVLCLRARRGWQGHEVVVPSHHAALCIHTAAQEVEAAGPVVVVLEVVFARPHRCTGAATRLAWRPSTIFSRRSGAGQSPAAAGHAQRSAPWGCQRLATRFWPAPGFLRRRPQLHHAVVPPGGVLRPSCWRGDERVFVARSPSWRRPAVLFIAIAPVPAPGWGPSCVRPAAQSRASSGRHRPSPPHAQLLYGR